MKKWLRAVRRLFVPDVPPITLDTVLMAGKRRLYTQEQVDALVAKAREPRQVMCPLCGKTHTPPW